jgi:flavodoxin
MKLIIVVHTQSGHTGECARAVAERFRNAGHDVDISMLRTVGAVSPRSTKFDLKNPPEINEYDGVIFGAPVWAFTASPVIMKYLGGLKNMKGKKALNFVTKGLPFNWTGGTQALKAMDNEVETTNGTVLQGEIVRFGIKADKEKMKALADSIFSKFTA